MMVIVPKDGSLANLLPPLVSGMPDPLTEDIQLMQFLVSSHIIVRAGTIPKSVFERVPEYTEIIKINLQGENVIFHKEDATDFAPGRRNSQLPYFRLICNRAKISEVIKANGVALGDSHQTSEDSSIVYQSARPLFRNSALVEEAIARMAAAAGIENPIAEVATFTRESEDLGHLLTTYVPALDHRISYALRSVGASMFANAWITVKEHTQYGIIERKQQSGGIIIRF